MFIEIGNSVLRTKKIMGFQGFYKKPTDRYGEQFGISIFLSGMPERISIFFNKEHEYENALEVLKTALEGEK